MTQTPERIWADPPEMVDGMDIWRSEPGGKSVEYIRADLVPQWQPIETAPRDGTTFLAYEKRDVSHYPCWWNNDFQEWTGWQDDWDSEPEPTHWMPLPAPPA